MKWSIQYGCLWVLLLFAADSFAQLTTSGGGPVSANALVSNLVGQGVSFSNATYTGKNVAIGTFNGTASNIGLNSGVIITTGHINIAPGPNNNAGATFSNNGPAIPELQHLAKSITFDGAILEFDFVPQSNFISFRYVFASEEYNEYVCSEFNDAFAFFITGPGIVGAENLALVPSTTIPVTINTINNGAVGALGSASNLPCELGNAAYYIDNTQNSVQYDGFTTVLVAQRAVIPCQTYHIRLMIADGADDIFDSAVFLEENSFSSATYTISLSTPQNDSTIYEGCTTATVTFSRPNPDPSPLTINYAVSGSAQPGVDYPALPGFVTIPGGQPSVSFNINAFADALNEGEETLTITGLTSCGDVPVTLRIKEKPAIYISIPTRSLCNGNGPVTLTANVNGGVQPLSYLWSNGATTASISVNPPGSATYQVEVSDFCGTKAIQNTTVNISPIPTASIDAPPFVCSSVPVTVRYTGTASPSATYIWNFDNPSSVSSGSDQGPYQISWDSSGTKTIRLQVIENGCASALVTAQTIVNPTPTASFVVDPVVCAGQNTTVTYTGTGTNMAGYGWGFPGGVIITGGRRGPFEIRWDSAGVYGVTLTVTENGCTSPGGMQNVTVRPSPISSFTVKSPVCIGEPSTVTYTGQASPAATFNWNFAGATILSGSGPGPYQVKWNSPGTKDVFLSVTENGCTGKITHHPVIVNPNPTGNFSLSGPICEGQPLTVTYTGSAANNAVFQWNFDGANVISGSGQGPYTISWNQAGAYSPSLIVNENGCKSVVYSSLARVNPVPKADFNLTGPVCTGESALITYSGSLGNNASFTWDFNGGQIISGSGKGSYNVYWQTPGNKQVTLVTVSPEGCPSQPSSHTLQVKPTPSAVFSAQTPVCIDEPSRLLYTGTANPSADYQWSLSGGQIIAGSGQGPLDVSWSVAGIKNIRLVVAENGCYSPEYTQQVRVKPLPSGAFSVTSPVCADAPSSISYSGSASQNAFFDWDFNQGSIVAGSGAGPYQISWSLEGPKNITLRVVEDGCASIVETRNVTVLPIPNNDFSVQAPLCQFEKSVISYTGNAFPNATYIWDFDGATILSGQGRGPYQLSWDTPGEKRVSLQVFQSGCQSPVSVKSIQVNALPESPFIASASVCTGQEAEITYMGNAGSQAAFFWNFNGAAVVSGTGKGPYKLTWNTPGEKKIILTVEENGCRSFPTEIKADVHAYPQALIEAEPLSCQGTETDLRFTGDADPAATFVWNFGGAEIVSGTGRGPYKIKWNTSGNKTVSLNLSQYGCSASPVDLLLTVSPAPEANAGDDQLICSGEKVSLGSPSQNGYSYLWIPADGLDNPANAMPELQFYNNGNEATKRQYILKTTLGGCSNYDTVEVLVKPEPRLVLNKPNAQCFNSHSLNFETAESISGAYQYQWDFGNKANNRFSEQSNPTGIQYVSPGVYVYKLNYVFDGCPGGEIIDSVQIFAMPDAKFSGAHLEGCPPLKASPLNQSVYNPKYKYIWDFGEGGTVEAFQPQYTYSTEGNYTVTLNVVDENGCLSSFSLHSLVNVYPVPRAGFAVNPEELSTEHPLATITDQSKGAVSWRYLTGTGSVVYQQNFNWNYPVEGNYQISQEVTNTYGCKDSVLKKLKVKPVMTFFVPNAFTPNKDGENELFKCVGINVKEFSMSIFNRWGELLFHSNDINEGWNGRKFNNQNNPVSQMDVYAVLIYVKDDLNQPARRIDHRVTLVR